MREIPPRIALLVCSAVVVTAGAVVAAVGLSGRWSIPPARDQVVLLYQPRKALDTGGFATLAAGVRPWPADASLQTIGDSWKGAARRRIESLDQTLAAPGLPDGKGSSVSSPRPCCPTPRATWPRASWAWDYDNDGWLDIFATCYDRTLEDVVKGLVGQPHGLQSNRLFRNLQGKGFKDVTREAGLDMVFATMGSNFGDFDNDGYPDLYLGTGEPSLAMLVPNRLFKNVGGRRFAEITASSRTRHLQKGHAVACGDWDRDGNVDSFMETGGASVGDRYHNVLFQNPGQGNDWLTVKLVGKKTNRAAVGARLKVVTAGGKPLTVHRHVSSGSSFGANPLEQTIGVGKADRVAVLEIDWPTSGTTQVFRDVAVNQAIEVTEFAPDYRRLDWKPLPSPTGRAGNKGGG
jgi:hypothetical protein